MDGMLNLRVSGTQSKKPLMSCLQKLIRQNRLIMTKKDFVITACGKGGGRSADGARILKEFGLNASWLCGGTNEWLGLD